MKLLNKNTSRSNSRGSFCNLASTILKKSLSFLFCNTTIIILYFFLFSAENSCNSSPLQLIYKYSVTKKRSFFPKFIFIYLVQKVTHTHTKQKECLAVLLCWRTQVFHTQFEENEAATWYATVYLKKKKTNLSFLCTDIKTTSLFDSCKLQK